MTDTPEHSTAPPVITDLDVNMLSSYLHDSRARLPFTFSERDDSLRKVLRVLLSIADGSVVCVPRSEIEETIADLIHLRFVDAQTRMAGWLSDTTPMAVTSLPEERKNDKEVLCA